MSKCEMKGERDRDGEEEEEEETDGESLFQSGLEGDGVRLTTL